MLERLRHIVFKVGEFFNGAGRAVLTLVGIKKVNYEEWNCEGAVIAGWIFLLGLPVGTMLMGIKLFSLSIWFGLVLSGLMLSNLDDALNFISNCMEHGVDGVCKLEVPPYGDSSCR